MLMGPLLRGSGQLPRLIALAVWLLTLIAILVAEICSVKWHRVCPLLQDLAEPLVLSDILPVG